MVDNKSRSEGLEVKMPKKINIPNGAVLIRGQALDGCDATFLTEDELRDIDTILAYDYEDGKPWHDCTCVLEIIFYNYHDNIENNKIRILYDHKASLLLQLAQFLFDSSITANTTFGDFRASGFIKVKIDLETYSFDDSDENSVINMEDFDVFNCRIKHKKHFHILNPEMPDD